MKKRILSALLCLMMLVTLLPASAWADTTYSGSCGDNATWTYDRDTYTLTISGTGEVTSAPWRDDLPSTTKSYLYSVVVQSGITSLCNYAFSGLSCVYKVSLPDTLTAIPNGAFSGCFSVMSGSITLPNSITSIGKEAFYGCKYLTGITLPDRLTTIGDEAFYECDDLADVSFPSTLTTIGYEAFYDCNALTSVTFPDGLTTIGYSAFRDSALASVTIPASVTSMGTRVFADCPVTAFSVDPDNPCYCNDSAGVLFNKDKTTLMSFPRLSTKTTYTVPSGVTSIDPLAFSRCKNLTSVTVPSGVRSIGDRAFYYCSSLTSVSLGAGPTSIPSGMFHYCTKLTEITIPNGVTTIGSQAFYQCWNLTTATIPSSVVSIEYQAFYSDYGHYLSDVYFGGTEKQWNAIEIASKNNGLLERSTIHFGKTVDPTVLSIDNVAETGAIKLTWEAVDSAVSYVVWRGLGDSYYTRLCTVNGGTSFVDNNVTPGTTYYYNVNAMNAASEASDTSNTVSLAAACARPTLSAADKSPTGGVQLKWEAVDGAATYVVYRGSPGGRRFLPCGTTTDTSFSDLNTTPGTSYSYRVRALTENEVASAPSETVTCIAICAAPVLNLSTDANGDVLLTWEAVPGATGYDLYFSEDGKSFTHYDSTVDTDYTDKQLSPGDTCYYKLVATCSDSSLADSAFSNVVSCTVAPAAPVVSISTVTSTGRIKLTWSAVDGAAKYYIYRSTDGGKTYKYYDSTTKTSYTNTSVTPGTKYYYKLKSVSATGEKSAYSNAVYRTADCAKPSLSSSIVTSSGAIKLTWGSVTGASKYYIYRSTDGGTTYKYYTSTTSTSWTNKSVTPGTKYYYKIKAICSNTEGNSAYSNIVYRTADCAKPSLSSSIVSSSGAIKLSWSKVTGATKYYIYRSTDGGTTYKYYTSTTSTSWTNKSVTPGTKYYYKIKAICSNTEGNSAYSNVVYRTADCAKPVVTIQLNSGKPQLKWSAVTGATKYYIYRSTDGTNFSFFDSTTKLSYTNTGAKSGTTYYYKVKAICSNTEGNSAYSSVVSIKSK